MHASLPPTPYADVNTLLAAFTEHVQATLGAQLVGIYLSGSLALGDFDPETSDIDLVVVTDGALAGARVEALAEMHKRFAAGASRWARKLEVVYAPREALAGEQPDATRYPQVETELGFVLKPLEDGWLAQCATVREHGVMLFGPEPKRLFQAVDVGAMRQSVARIPEMWRNDAQNDPSWLEWLRVRHNQSFVVLTLCRLLYTLETGAVASKPTAARWAQDHVEARWRALIERALVAKGDHSPTPEADMSEADITETVALVEFTVEQFRSSRWLSFRGAK